MKKNNFLSLSISTLALAILPVAAISSCSTTTGKNFILDNETSKFEKIFEVKPEEKTITATTAASIINLASTNDDKLDLLSNFIDLPIMNKEFNYEIKSASVDTTVLSKINVALEVSHKATTQLAAKTIEVTGFSQMTPEQELAEKAKLLIDKETIKGKDIEKSKEVALKLISDQTLASYYAEISLGTGFTYYWKSSEAIGNKVKVVVVVLNKASGAKLEKTFNITGFKVVREITQQYLQQQLELFTDQNVLPGKAHETPFIVQALFWNDPTVSIDDYYPKVELEEGLSYVAQSVLASSSNNLIVLIKLSSDTPGINDVHKPVIIFGLSSPLKHEAHKFDSPIPVNDRSKTVKTNEVISSILSTNDNIERTRLLNRYLSINLYPNLDFTWSIGTPVVDPNAPTSVKVPIKITQISEPSQVADVTLVITGLVAASAAQ